MGRLDSFNQLLKLSFRGGVSPWKKLCLMADVLKERLLYKTEIQDYFQYEFYRMKSPERREYMTFSRLRETMRICNDPSKRVIFDDKARFNTVFQAFVFRDWLDVSGASFEAFDAFLGRNPAFFVKAKSGMFGKYAEKLVTDPAMSMEKKRGLYEDLRKKECLAEELISQHPSLAAFNESSVNTMRVVTLLCAEGKPKIMAAVLRIGRKGKTADNFHHYGIAATIDVETGRVNAPGIDREFVRYETHPDSGLRIPGFPIPSWEKIAALVTQAAGQVQEVRYVGWDVAVDAKGEVQLIEGNYGADPDVTQMPCRKGIWPAYETELRKLQGQ